MTVANRSSGAGARLRNLPLPSGREERKPPVPPDLETEKCVEQMR